jgi:hypothetical protein
VLHELVPKAGVIALLVNPTNRYTETETNVTQESARSLGLKLRILNASNAGEIDAAFSSLGQASDVALLVSADLFFLSRREQIVAQASARSLPTIYGWREYVAAGGLMSYGPNLYDAYRLVGVYTGKILNGASPAARANNQGRLCDQSEDGQITWLDLPSTTARPRRRGDRIERFLLQCMSSLVALLGRAGRRPTWPILGAKQSRFAAPLQKGLAGAAARAG